MRANRRRGTASTKTKADVNLSGAKPWRQKGTGRARAAIKSSPIWVGGGVAFGPHPRDYSKKIPKKVKALAFRKALSERVLAGDVLLVDGFCRQGRPRPSNSSPCSLKTAGNARKTLIVSAAFDEKTYLAARNVKTALLARAADVNTEQLLAFDKIIVTKDALATLSERLALMKESFDHIQTVLLTEKATLLSEKHNQYVFRVSPKANKIEIKRAVELLFKKTVVRRQYGQLRREKEARAHREFRPPQPLEKGRGHAQRGRKNRPSLSSWDSRKFEPLTPSSRFKVLPDFSEITKDRPEKTLTSTRKGTGGRNNHGRLTLRHRGGGHKRKYRLVDFKRKKRDVPAEVLAIEYDPNRSARIALAPLQGWREILHPRSGGSRGRRKSSARENRSSLPLGNALPLKAIPLGTTIHNIEIMPGRGAQMIRSAGSQATLANREGGYALIKLASGEIRKINEECYATIGQVGNTDHMNVSSGKAGRTRWLGRRPHVRGMVMNPIDHPMGGGQGKSKGGGGRHHPMSPWGQLAKGFKTRRKHKPSERFIVQTAQEQSSKLTMARSLKKGPFVEWKLLDKIDRMNESGGEKADQDVVAPQHGHPRLCRPHLQRA